MTVANFTSPRHTIIAAAFAAFAVVTVASRGASAQGTSPAAEQWIHADVTRPASARHRAPLPYRNHPWIASAGMTWVSTGGTILAASLVVIAAGIAESLACLRNPCTDGGGIAISFGAIGVLGSLVLTLPGSFLWMAGSWRRPLVRSASNASPLPDVAIGPQSLSVRWTF